MKKYFLGFLLLFLAAGTVWLWAETIIRPDATSSDGLKVSRFSLRGDLTLKGKCTIVFQLTNTTDHDITFHPNYGVFVGARLDETNIDFGHRAKGHVLPPGGHVNIKAPHRFDRRGVYVFWPAYHANGHWGPYKWNAITVTIQE